MNPQAKSQLVVLASARTPYKTDQLNDVRFSMTDIIKAPEQHYAAMVSLQSMNFFNTFHNITTANNKLQVVLTYEVGGDTYTSLQDRIAITPGNYDAVELAAAIEADPLFCAKLPAMANGGAGGNLANMTMTISRNTAKASIVSNTLIQANAVTDINIRSIGFLADATTQPLMTILGFYDESGPGIYSDIQPIFGTNFSGVVFQYAGVAGALAYVVPPGNSMITLAGANLLMEPPNLSNVVTTPAIQVDLNGIRSDVKAGSNLSRGATIAIVPVTSGFGGAVNFYPPNPHKSMVTDMYLSEFHISIRDASSGQFVDFNGIDWIISINIEWAETETSEQSDLALNNIPRKILPLYHSSTYDHLTLPTERVLEKKRKKDREY